MHLRVTDDAPTNLSFPYTDALAPGDEFEVDDEKGAALLDTHAYLDPVDPGDAAEITLEDDEYETLDDLTVAELRERARDAEVDGRSGMNKAELIDALAED